MPTVAESPRVRIGRRLRPRKVPLALQPIVPQQGSQVTASAITIREEADLQLVQSFVASLEGTAEDTSQALVLAEPAIDRGPVPTLEELFEDGLKDAAKDVSYKQALKNLGLSENDLTLPSMKIPLLPHQVIGVDWLQRQEERALLQGGILADEMGLGKLIAVILEGIMTHKQSQPSSRLEPTLVVVPSRGLLDQWYTEIARMAVDDNLTIHCYIGSDRRVNSRHLTQADVVLTTYGTVLSEAKTLFDENSFIVDDDYSSSDELDDGPGPLIKTEWHRVILDEAAYVRNMVGRKSQAIHYLNSDIRWCLTATPIHNSLLDIFPYLKFDGVVFWDDFHNKILKIMGKNRDLALRRVQAILRQCSLRRTKHSTIDGRKILQLPHLDQKTIILKLTPHAREIYDYLADTFEKQLEDLMHAGTNNGKGLVTILRLMKLRQACCHHRLACADRKWLEKLLSVGGGRMDGSEDYDEEIEDARDEEQILSEAYEARHIGNQVARPRPNTSKRTASQPSSSHPSRKRKRASSSRGGKHRHIDPAISEKDPSVVSALDKEAEVSAKITKIYELLQSEKWKGHKTLIFCSFVEMLQFTGAYLRQKGIKCVEYHGKCSQIAKERNLRLFKSDKPRMPTVMLLMHRCGGEGLNLTIASRIILASPSWTYAEVMQTIGRAHRIGQKETLIVRELIFEDTVEETVKERQKVKRDTATGALGDDSITRLGSMTFDELLQLFQRKPCEPQQKMIKQA